MKPAATLPLSGGAVLRSTTASLAMSFSLKTLPGSIREAAPVTSTVCCRSPAWKCSR